MALYAPGSVIESISGSTPSAQFLSRDTFGVLRSSARSWSRSRAALSRRASPLASLLQLWHTLPQSDRLAWNTYADTLILINGFPADRSRSGVQRFLLANSILVGSGQPPKLSSPPTSSPQEASTPLDVAVDLSSGELVIRTIEGFAFRLLSPQTLRFRASIPQRRSRSAIRDLGRVVGYAVSIGATFPWFSVPLRISLPSPPAKGEPFQLEWTAATDSGATSPTRTAFVDVPDPGLSTAFRLRKQFGFGTFTAGGWWRRRPSGVFRIIDTDSGVNEFSLLGSPGPTVAALRSWITNTVGWEIRDVDSSFDARPAADIPVSASKFLGIEDNLGLVAIPTVA